MRGWFDIQQFLECVRNEGKHPFMGLWPQNFLNVRHIQDYGYIINVDQDALTRQEFLSLANAIADGYGPITRAEIEQAKVNRDRQREIRRARIPKPDRKPKRGFIYILKAGPHYKIGQSVNVDKRLEQISPKMPIAPKLIHSFPVDDMDEAEADLHAWFAEKRTNGEWFVLGEADIEWLCGLTEFEVV